jgi:hypothetical protein
MKKLLLLTFALSLFACDGGDDNDNSNSSSIEGRWNLTYMSFQGVEQDLNSCDLETYIELNNSGTGIYYLYYTDWPDNPEIEPCGLDEMYDITFANTSSNTYSMDVDYEESVSSGTATINNNVLTFSGLTFEDLPFTEVFTKQ